MEASLSLVTAERKADGKEEKENLPLFMTLSGGG